MPLASPTPSGVLWTVVDANSRSIVAIRESTIEYHVPDQYSKPSTATFTLETPVDAAHTYFVTVLNLQYDNCPAGTPSSAAAKLSLGQPPEKKRLLPFTFSATKGRDDSDLYLSGLIQGAHEAKASYTADVKAQFQVPIKNASTGANNRFRAGWWFVPSYDFKASTDPKMDGNSVTAAAAITHGLSLSNELVPWNELAPAFALESDKQYRAINSVANLRTDFLMRGFGSGQLQLYMQPFFVLVAGGNTRAPSAAAYPGAIVRPAAGLHAYVNLFKTSKPGRMAFIESEYTRRWPLLSEPVFSEDKSGVLHLVSVGTNPRDYVWTKCEFDFTDYLGLTLGYDYGELPPVYVKVDSKYSVGIVVKTGLKYKPK
ncbi:MAG: hypothetical protein WAN12_13330 [Candidatus Acidiferrum sp.]